MLNNQEVKMFVMNGFQMRSFQLKDALKYMELYNHPLVEPYIPFSMIPKNLEASRVQIQECFLSYRPFPYWAIVDTQDEFVGSCGFVNMDSYHKRIEIAYDVSPQYWGRGIAASAINVCLKYAFERLKMRRVEAVTLNTNDKSMKVLQKCGFTYEGTLRAFKQFRGKTCDVESFSFTWEDYLKVK